MARRPKAEGDADHEPLQVVVGARVREARKRAKLKQSELGAVIGSGQSHVFMIEAGEVNLTLKTLMKLATALGVAPRDLLLDKPATYGLDEVAARELSELLESIRHEFACLGDRLRRAEALLAPQASRPEISTRHEG